MTTRFGVATYEGAGKEGRGRLSTQSGVLNDQAYGFGTRFGDERGTNPEELIAAAHAGCFTMALSFALAKAGAKDARLGTEARVTLDKEGEGFRITRSDLTLTVTVPEMDEAEVRRLAEEAKVNCPVSKLMNAEMTLEVKVEEAAAA